jgi:uncharacterized membrane protein YhhN
MVPVLAVVVVGALAVFSAERQLAWLHIPTKPLTTALLALIVGWPRTRLAVWVDVGIALSVIGDIALLDAGKRAFLVGLAVFLLAHLAYGAAFASVAVWSPHVAIVAVAAIAATTLVLRAIRHGTVEVRGPTIAYGVVITTMVIAASATIGGPLASAPLAAGGGAVLRLGRQPGAQPLPPADPARGVPDAGALLDRADRDRARGAHRAVGRPGQPGRTAPGMMRSMTVSQIRKKLVLSSSGFIQPTVMQ